MPEVGYYDIRDLLLFIRLKNECMLTLPMKLFPWGVSVISNRF